jgi:hypothetical protein
MVQNVVGCCTSLREISMQHIMGGILTPCSILHYKTIILTLCLHTELYWCYSWKELFFQSFGWICKFTYEGINFCRNALFRVGIIYQFRGSLTSHLTYRQVKQNFVIFHTHTHARARAHTHTQCNETAIFIWSKTMTSLQSIQWNNSWESCVWNYDIESSFVICHPVSQIFLMNCSI